MKDERKDALIDQLRHCQKTIEQTVFNTKVASKAKVSNEVLEVFKESLRTQTDTFEKLNQIIKGLQENPDPDLDLLTKHIGQMVQTTNFQERETREFCKTLFNQE